MVGAACHIAREAMLQGKACGEQCACATIIWRQQQASNMHPLSQRCRHAGPTCNLCLGPLNERWAPCDLPKADAPHACIVQRPAAEGPDKLCGVNLPQPSGHHCSTAVLAEG